MIGTSTMKELMSFQIGVLSESANQWTGSLMIGTSIMKELMSFQIRVLSESSLWNHLNVKELLAQNKRNVWDLSYRSGIGTHKHFLNKHSVV